MDARDRGLGIIQTRKNKWYHLSWLMKELKELLRQRKYIPRRQDGMYREAQAWKKNHGMFRDSNIKLKGRATKLE